MISGRRLLVQNVLVMIDTQAVVDGRGDVRRALTGFADGETPRCDRRSRAPGRLEFLRRP